VVEEILKMIENKEEQEEDQEDIGKIIITILVVEEMKDLVQEIKEAVVEQQFIFLFPVVNIYKSGYG
jgi:hypothetical protein